MSVEPCDLEEEVRVEIDAIKTEFIELFMRYCRRWRTLVLGSPGQHWERFYTLGADDLPQLENVYTPAGMLFLRPDHQHGSQLAPAGKLLTRTTSLRRLDMKREWISVQMLDLPLEWSHLTELRIASPICRSSEPDSFDLGAFLQALAEQCNSLVVFSLTDIMSFLLCRSLDASSFTPVSWPTIREFTFSARGLANENFMHLIRDAFERISLPNVERLSVGLCCGELVRDPTTSDSDFPEAPWEGLLLRSNPPLKHLELDFPRSHWGIRTVLRSLKPLCSLISLRVGHKRVWDMGYEELVRGLREPFEGGLLCPELEELELEECIADDVKLVLMLDRHFLMRHPKMKLIRANFGFGVECDGAVARQSLMLQGQEGFDVSMRQREVILTRK
ncbi:hypothetical protein AAF712_011127 [Marasmius tenuissimus]|uniref:F-box domain-containing protein n=1 Tax=Marasmius tenuissimus TaxID=585030 RepID=A0ABR2ZM94_9AGAR